MKFLCLLVNRIRRLINLMSACEQDKVSIEFLGLLVNRIRSKI